MSTTLVYNLLDDFFFFFFFSSRRRHTRCALVTGVQTCALPSSLLVQEIQGCPFRPRCDWAIDKCATDHPPLEEKEPAHFARCWRNPQVDEKTRIPARSAERSVGKEWVRTCRSRWARYHVKKQKNNNRMGTQ